MLYVTSPQALWLNVFHDTVNESSATSVTIRVGLSGVPMRKRHHYIISVRTLSFLLPLFIYCGKIYLVVYVSGHT